MTYRCYGCGREQETAGNCICGSPTYLDGDDEVEGAGWPLVPPAPSCPSLTGEDTKPQSTSVGPEGGGHPQEAVR